MNERRRRAPGLQLQIVAVLVVVALGGTFSVGFIALWRTREALVGERWERAAELAEGARNLVEANLAAGRPLPQAVSAAKNAIGAAELAALPDATGPWPAHLERLPTDDTGRAAARAGMAPHAVPRSGDPGRVVLYAGVSAPGRTPTVVRATFAVGEQIDQVLDRTRWTILLVSALDALVLAAAAAILLRGAVVRPVVALARAARRVADGDLAAQVGVRGPGEVGRLADDFERMTASLREGRESLIRSEKLASVGRLAAGVAHEVGNPLAAIVGYVELLLGDAPDRPLDPAVRRDVLERVGGEATRIHKIVQELLDYARPPRDGIEPVALAGVIDAAVSLVRAQARGKDVVVDVDLPADLPSAAASGDRLVQVLLNLLLNAADAMEGRGRIRVEARGRAGRVVLAVADEGPGVPAELRDRIFDPFFTTKDPGHGTGLGLAVCQAIVEGFGGEIRLAASDRGARFEVDLPQA